MTKTVSIHDAQNQLLKLSLFAMDGNEVILVKDNKPLARLVSVASPNQQKPRIAGLHKGKIWMSDDFDEPLPDEFWVGSKRGAQPVFVHAIDNGVYA